MSDPIPICAGVAQVFLSLSAVVIVGLKRRAQSAIRLETNTEDIKFVVKI
jgi:hypothetical protein